MTYVNTNAAAEDIDIGDVVAFMLNSESYATHRVIEKSDVSFITKGDANEDQDVSPVYFDQVIGETTGKIPFVGYIQLGLMSVVGKIVMFAVIALDVVIELILINKMPEAKNKASSEASLEAQDGR